MSAKGCGPIRALNHNSILLDDPNPIHTVTFHVQQSQKALGGHRAIHGTFSSIPQPSCIPDPTHALGGRGGAGPYCSIVSYGCVPYHVVDCPVDCVLDLTKLRFSAVAIFPLTDGFRYYAHLQALLHHLWPSLIGYDNLECRVFRQIGQLPLGRGGGLLL